MAVTSVMRKNPSKGHSRVLRWRPQNCPGDFRRGCAAGRQEGDLYYLVQMLIYLGQAAMLNGDVTASRPLFIDALRIARQIDDRLAQYDLLSLLGWHAVTTGHPRLAAQLLGAAESVGSGAGAGMAGPFLPLLAQANEAAVGALGASKFEAAYVAGKRLDREGP
jgi:hypothetical protein